LTDLPENSVDELENALEELEGLVARRAFSKAIERSTELIERFPSEFELFYRRAQAHNMMNQRVQAIDDVSRAIELQPREPALYFFRGLWNIERDQFNDCIADMEKVAALEGDFATAYYVESARFLQAIAYLATAEFEHAESSLDCCRYDMDLFVRGRMWSADHVRQHIRARRRP
jgi:tetratricopeptide (TPR) repeat protein